MISSIFSALYGDRPNYQPSHWGLGAVLFGCEDIEGNLLNLLAKAVSNFCLILQQTKPDHRFGSEGYKPRLTPD